MEPLGCFLRCFLSFFAYLNCLLSTLTMSVLVCLPSVPCHDEFLAVGGAELAEGPRPAVGSAEE